MDDPDQLNKEKAALASAMEKATENPGTPIPIGVPIEGKAYEVIDDGATRIVREQEH